MDIGRDGYGTGIRKAFVFGVYMVGIPKGSSSERKSGASKSDA